MKDSPCGPSDPCPGKGRPEAKDLLPGRTRKNPFPPEKTPFFISKRPEKIHSYYTLLSSQIKENPGIHRNHSVKGGFPLRISIPREDPVVPWPGGLSAALGIMRRRFLRGGGGGQGLPPPIAENPCFLRTSAHPDRCFRRASPKPPGQQQNLPPHP